jgi:probable phosphoglycerate mutase
MPRPILYFVRHGETDWNLERRLQGQHDIPLNALGRVQAARCGEILGDLLAANGRSVTAFDYLSSPLGRARETMELMRLGLGLDPGDYRTDARLMEMSFGRWEGFTFAELQSREAQALAARERDKWGFVLPGGESYAQLEVRVGAWYEGLDRDTVVASHGGVCRVLMAHLRITAPENASMGDIRQGVVYVFSGDAVTRHE